MRVLGLALLALTAVVSLAGCGGEGGSADTLTRAQFIAQADRICEQTDKTQTAAIKDFFAESDKTATGQELNEEAVLVAGLPPIRREAKDLAELPAPQGDEEKIEAIVQGIEEAVNAGEEDPGSLVRGSAGPFAAVGKMAREYGFKACAFPL